MQFFLLSHLLNSAIALETKAPIADLVRRHKTKKVREATWKVLGHHTTDQLYKPRTAYTPQPNQYPKIYKHQLLLVSSLSSVPHEMMIFSLLCCPVPLSSMGDPLCDCLMQWQSHPITATKKGGLPESTGSC